MTPPGEWEGDDYQARFDRLAATGADVHGEATFVRAYEPARVLDAGCGTGRVAIELARHGIEVVGVDVDASMLATARRLAPDDHVGRVRPHRARPGAHVRRRRPRRQRPAVHAARHARRAGGRRGPPRRPRRSAGRRLQPRSRLRHRRLGRATPPPPVSCSSSASPPGTAAPCHRRGAYAVSVHRPRAGSRAPTRNVRYRAPMRIRAGAGVFFGALGVLRRHRPSRLARLTGTFTVVDPPAAAHVVFAEDLNDAGQITGGSIFTQGGSSHAYLRDADGTYTDLDPSLPSTTTSRWPCCEQRRRRRGRLRSHRGPVAGGRWRPDPPWHAGGRH